MLPRFLMALLLAVFAPRDDPAHRNATLEWPRIEQQIQWHRDRVRACGPLSAIHALQLLGHDVDVPAILSSVKRLDDRGTPLTEVLRLCRDFEPRARIVRVPQKAWRRLDYPCILIVNEGHHAMVLRSLSKRQQIASVWDPSDLKVKTLSLDQLERLWTGDAILFRAYPWQSLVLGVVNLLMLTTLIVRQLRGSKRNRRQADHG